LVALRNEYIDYISGFIIMETNEFNEFKVETVELCDRYDWVRSFFVIVEDVRLQEILSAAAAVSGVAQLG
jgi:hypothetical protein